MPDSACDRLIANCRKHWMQRCCHWELLKLDAFELCSSTCFDMIGSFNARWNHHLTSDTDMHVMQAANLQDSKAESMSRHVPTC